ncbi:MAG: phenylacetate-CoA oxygenase subunit PaaJ [Rhizobacter sp.]|nr:phenylacetate-CoA oxygenase subunit PaaJ [Rhizobacter sp.]
MSKLLAAPLTERAAWETLGRVLDPEVPVLSVVELGIVRELDVQSGKVCVTVTPTYSGCPATEVIRDAIVVALQQAGAEEVVVHTRLSPPWTTDWIAPEAGEKLRRYGIAPPHLAGQALASQPLRFHPRDLQCPRCDSTHTEQLSAFGSTACKSLYRCLDCCEPFEYFKPL